MKIYFDIEGHEIDIANLMNILGIKQSVKEIFSLYELKENSDLSKIENSIILFNWSEKNKQYLDSILNQINIQETLEYGNIYGIIILNDTIKIKKDKIKQDENIKNSYKRLIFKLLKDNYKGQLSKTGWGILTGIRPVKVITQLKNKNLSDKEIFDILENDYLISKEKIEIINRIYNNQKEIINNLKETIGIYIAIPFCPSRCDYCSFFSMDINKYKNKVDTYLDTLEKEISAIQNHKKIKNQKISSIYIGGGTPSTLSVSQINRLFKIINDYIDTSNLLELTFEAGRPETLDYEKLKALKENKVTRISINPQTMNNQTLQTIKRLHTVEDIIEKYNMAKEIGFDNINMDLIMGLEGETLQDIEKSVNDIIKLDPESITIHCLSLKRNSAINQRNEEIKKLSDDNFSIKIYEKLLQNNYEPYYLYRQKNTINNMENIGYAKKEKFGIYNIGIMEEVQTIIAYGLGATSRFYYPEKDLITRKANYKDIILYINDIDKMIQRKMEVLDCEDTKTNGNA